MEIPYTQYHRPNGHQTSEKLDLPEEFYERWEEYKQTNLSIAREDLSVEQTVWWLTDNENEVDAYAIIADNGAFPTKLFTVEHWKAFHTLALAEEFGSDEEGNP